MSVTQVDYLPNVTEFVPPFFHDVSSSITDGEKTGWDLLVGGSSRHYHNFTRTSCQLTEKRFLRLR
jgi:hypothetical protein